MALLHSFYFEFKSWWLRYVKHVFHVGIMCFGMYVCKKREETNKNWYNQTRVGFSTNFHLFKSRFLRPPPPHSIRFNLNEIGGYSCRWQIRFRVLRLLIELCNRKRNLFDVHQLNRNWWKNLIKLWFVPSITNTLIGLHDCYTIR